MIDYVWTIETLWVKPVDGDLTDVAITAAWRCTGSDGTYSSSIYNTCAFSAPDADDFTPYADLTQAQVLDWCWQNGVNKDATETAIASNIDNQINPPIITPPLPWNQP